MKKIIICSLILTLAACGHYNKQPQFSISSADISPQSLITIKHVFDGFGCVGDNISPEFSWENAPKDTKSFALTIYDPDAPTGSGWWHWLVLNIPPNYDRIAQGFGSKNSFSLADNINQIRNDYGSYSFGGPCPPVDDKPHRYIVTLHALKTDKININKNSSAALAGFLINANSIAKASFASYYGR